MVISFYVRINEWRFSSHKFANWKIGLLKLFDKYPGEKLIDVDNRLFNDEKSIENLENIDNKTNMIIGNYKPKIQIKYGGKKRVFSIS